MNKLVAPSILSANFGKLNDDIEMINRSEADWIHCDIMDGRFVPNISFGFPVLSAVKKVATKPLDVHLMIVEPEKYITQFKKAGADILSVHIEACNHLHRTIQEIKEAGMVNLQLYDVKGQLVKTIINENQSKGKHSLILDNTCVSHGNYILNLISNNSTETKKLIINE